MTQSYRSIILTLLPEASERTAPSPATKLAVEMARAFGGFVTADFLAPKPAWVPYSLLTELPLELLADEEKRLEAQAHATLRLAAETAEAAGVGAETNLVSLDFIALVGRAALRARLQDVIVMDSSQSSLREEIEIAEAMIFRTARPLIRVPAGHDGSLPGKVVVAWDGSVPAARAAREALPILQAAETVEIATVQGEKDVSAIAPGEKLARYLERHDVRATQTTLTAARRDVAETLRAHVTATDAEFLVMGAYAHSRLAQAILGGVTASLLRDAPVPLLLAH
ncbi:universal stress protein [Aureimonas altamirensis]|uniref:universal stress protein n=1 Tax=Aureimonas altamirensis TaxID=370622 RepID=UPI001E5D0690|nr:universal stress protein [Aureimonas altamirensis]UHD46475.1 universal stress protein [Aureimonas altamirensis]